MNDVTHKWVATPLKGSTAKGTSYVRPKRVEDEIEAALDMPLHNAFSRAASGMFMPQTVVHLIRNFRPNRRTTQHGAMVEWFFGRVSKRAEWLLSDLPQHQRERGREMAEEKVLEWFDDERMDIFEMSFRHAMERITIDIRRKLQVRAKAELPIEDMADAARGHTGEEALDALLVRTGTALPLAEARATLSSALSLLTAEERHVLIAMQLLGMTETETAATIGECSTRKVRYVLKRALLKARAEGITG